MICVKCGAEVPDLPYCGLCGWKQAQEPKAKTKRGNGQGRVWKRGSSWYAQVTLYSYAEKREDGSLRQVQKRRTKGGFPTKKAALAALESLRGPQGRDCPSLLHYWQLYEGGALGKLSADKQTAYRAARRRWDSLIHAAGSGKLLKINKDNFYKAYYSALETAGVRKLPPYSCRHTTGTEAARANLSAPVIQLLMRHSKITTTQRYIHLASDAAHGAVNALPVANK